VIASRGKPEMPRMAKLDRAACRRPILPA